MINKKILVSGLSVVSTLALMGGTAFALFSDTATATNNTFATGNADLQISLNGEDYDDSIPGPTFTGMFPGDSRTYDFWLKNNSSAAISLNLTSDVSAINPDPDGNQEIDNTLLVSWVCDPENDGFGDNIPTSEFSPRDWFNGGNASLGSLAQNVELACQLTGRIPSSADGSIAGETIVFDAVYDGVQAP